MPIIFLGDMASVEIDNLAREIADARSGWDALRMLLDEDVAALAKALEDMKIRSFALLRNRAWVATACAWFTRMILCS